MSPPTLSRVQQLVLGLIEIAADEGLPCPTNTQLFDELGVSISEGSTILVALELKGLIKVERGSSRRVVTIVATGKRTAGEITNTHWRYRPKESERQKAKRRVENHQSRMEEVELRRVDRDPCFRCGSRKDACQCGERARA